MGGGHDVSLKVRQTIQVYILESNKMNNKYINSHSESYGANGPLDLACGELLAVRTKTVTH